MRRSLRSNRGFGLLFSGMFLLPLAGCGSATDGGVSSTLGNLIAFNSPTPPPVRENKEAPVLEVECPEVMISEGQSAFRTYTGADKSSAGVKHQYSFGEMSRECIATKDRIDIRVGVSGYVLSGPMGGPGAFQVPVRVSIRRDSDGQIVQSRTYRIAAAITAEQPQAPFAVVTEPLSVPFTRAEANMDYSIFVGFDATPEKPQKAAPKQRKN